MKGRCQQMKTAELPYYTPREVMKLVRNNEEFVYVQDDIGRAIIRKKDIPDFIVYVNREFGETDFSFAEVSIIETNSKIFYPIITTDGEFLDEVKPEIREQIIERLTKLQKGEIKPKKFKLIDISEYKEAKKLFEKSTIKKNNIKDRER